MRTVLHPTDFSTGSEAAFAHALQVAVRNRARLTLLHVTEGSARSRWSDFPAIRDTLQRWGLLERGVERDEITPRLGMEVRKLQLTGGRVLPSLLGYLEDHETDLIVLATRGREGPPRWLSRPVAEPLARRALVPALFVPWNARGIVAVEDGTVTLRQVLVPVDHDPRPDGAIARAMRALESYAAGGHLTLLHVGAAGAMPALRVPDREGWSWSRATRPGEPVTEIVAAAEEGPADLIVMATAGREGFIDVLRGTTTERVLRQAPCPVLAVPAD